MQVNDITAFTSDYGAISDGATRVPSKVLNQNDFLKLLVTQMTSQDPLNPKSDTDMAAQMAQFTALEQSSNMATNITNLLAGQQISQASSLIGRNVKLQVDSETTTSGLVDTVQILGGIPKVIVGGVAYDLTQVTTISPAQSTTVPTGGQ